MDTVLELTKENIQEIVDASMQQVVVLGFWAEQSPESVDLGQVLTHIAQQQAGRFILARINCEIEIEIANYFQVQNLPTTLILHEGKPVDGFSGVKDTAEILQLLDQHLPPQWQLALNEAKTLLAEQDWHNALPLLKRAFDENPIAEVSLVYCDAQLMAGELIEAESLLDSVGLADQDGYYQSLKAKLALALEAADTPEIRLLQSAFDNNPDNIEAIISLVKALHQASRNEEALALIFEPLKKDVNAGNGDVKHVFLEILTALGQGHLLANQYRRRLYTLLY
ncbi:tetratricopeptide repeat protein [Shewanella surugensis]|uniref:Tetratricopeptide repeat protein n=1 Tax=Shewanella surugensis TaxID=212020 RepID=A0ABT0LD18_9GAMM|nr:tetratricopeptide repeat protein [Shewanella surugensis]MCL1125385.1 tetratricopeptide repeat protein [Shewanella surugensis]